jgi:hypothetical protein
VFCCEVVFDLHVLSPKSLSKCCLNLVQWVRTLPVRKGGHDRDLPLPDLKIIETEGRRKN